MHADHVILGRSRLRVSRLGLGSSFGLEARDVEYAFERGVNYLYWGSLRRPAFGRAIRHLARRHRDDMVVVVQTYSRARLAVGPSLDLALRRLKLDHADVLLLGLWNHPPPARIVDAALTLREAGKVRAVMISCHNRPTFPLYIDDPCYDAIMVRYNAAHRGAEAEVFPHLPPRGPDSRGAGAPDAGPDGAGPVDVGLARPGVVAYTATRWGQLLDPARIPTGEPVPRGSDCYRFALSHPDVDVCLAGPADRAQLDEALAALDRGPMDADELAWMRRVGDAVHAGAPTRLRVRSPLQLWARVTGRLQRPRPPGP